MDLFEGAKAVRLRSHHRKYLVADDDGEHVSQDRSGSSRAARWSVEVVDAVAPVVRLRSCYGRYLTPSDEPFLLGLTGRKVIQTLPSRLDSSVEWEPLRDASTSQVKLKTRYGNFLRANGGFPPWRNSVTHDVPHTSGHQGWLLWDVDVVDLPDESSAASPASSPRLTKQESSSSLSGSPHRGDGRMIHYRVAEEDGSVDDSVEGLSFMFKGTSVAELTERLEEETELQGIFVCSRSPLNRKLYPLRLHLPPNNATMNVVVVPASTRGICRSNYGFKQWDFHWREAVGFMP